MIVYFCVENFLSFQEKVEFNMLAAPSTATTDKAKKIPEMDLDLLRVAAVYGANNAGKSNFIKALAALQSTVTGNGLYHKPFLLNEDNQTRACSFEIEFIMNDVAYRYGIAYFADYIAEEYLYELALPSTDKKLIFSRKSTASKNIELDYNFAQEDPSNQMRLDIFKNDFLKTNQSFLSISEPVFDKIKPAHSFFKNYLKVYPPDDFNTHLHRLTVVLHIVGQKNYALKKTKNPESVNNFIDALSAIPNLLPLFGTGIDDLQINSMSFDEYFKNNFQLKTQFLIQLSQKEKDPTSLILIDDENGVIGTYNENGEAVVKWVEAIKSNDLNKPIRFNLQQESDGTRKLLALFSEIVFFFTQSYSKNHVLVFDEIERSLHTHLLNQLLPLVLGLSNSANQLIFSTHEVSLLDLLPTDAVWFVEQNEKHSSEMYSLWEFETIENVPPSKGYLQGRYGAIAYLEKLKQKIAEFKQQQAHNERKQSL